MSKIKQQNATIIDNDFIDKFMPAANGEYVKVYLYMLRMGMDEIEDEEIADALDMTVKDVQRAFAYWKKVGLIDEDEQIDHPEKKPADIVSLSEDEEFAALLYSTQQYLGKVFNHDEMEIMAYIYDELKLSTELIEYLVEKCAKSGKDSLRYIEKVAIDWHSKGITTVDEAKGDFEIYKEQISCVIKAFGIKGRDLGDSEKKLVKKWFAEWGFSTEMVADACARTLSATGNAVFNYADSILRKWKEEGAAEKSDIDKLDKAHDEKTRSRRESAKKEAFAYNNQANSHSNSQYDAIMREYDLLLGKEKNEAKERVEEVYRKVPRIKELDEQVSSSSVASVRARLAGGDGSDFARKLEEIKREKAYLLSQAGFEPNYMEIRYTCQDCKDTGLVNGKKCHCFIEKENLLKEGKL